MNARKLTIVTDILPIETLKIKKRSMFEIAKDLK